MSIRAILVTIIGALLFFMAVIFGIAIIEFKCREQDFFVDAASG